MVYSGDNVYFAVQLPLNEAFEVLKKYFKCKKISFSDDHEKFEFLEKLLEESKFEFLEIYRAPCCHFTYDTHVYIGVHLGTNEIVYRSQVYTYDTFAEYKEQYLEGIKDMEEKLSNLNKYEEEIKILFPKIKPKFHSLANDCESCS